MDGQPNANPGMTPDMMKAFAEYMGGQFARMDQADEAATQFQEASRTKINESINDMLAQTLMKSGEKKPQGPQYPPQVAAIANALMLQPQLIPAVDRFLRHIVSELNDALNKVVDECIDDTGTQDVVGPQAPL